MAASPRIPSVATTKEILEQYECGPIRFTGTPDALYERHLMFDNVVYEKRGIAEGEAVERSGDGQ